MTAGNYDITIEQGATFELHIIYETGSPAAPVNLTGWTARMQVRLNYKSPDPPLLNFTTENGAITLGSAGQIDVVGLATLTDTLPAKECVYDLEIANGTLVRRVVQGAASISPQVTR